MGVKERILTIRLMEKANANPAFAQRIGLTASYGPVDAENRSDAHSEKQKS